MSIKFARGQSGQATFEGNGPTSSGNHNTACHGENDSHPTGEWEILLPYVESWNSTNKPGDWSVALGGQITVPPNATPSFYKLKIVGEDCYSEVNGGQTLYGNKYYYYSFEVVCMTVKISAIEAVRDEAMNTVLHECRAIVRGGRAPYQYTWSVLGGTVVTGQGTSVVGVNFPPNTSGSVSLTVSEVNAPFCSATDSIPIVANPIDFTITRPLVSGTGDVTGTRDGMRFSVVVEAVANGAILNAPATISFQLGHPGVGTVDVIQVSGELVFGSNPPRYRGSWDVTKAKGRWNIQVESPHRSNTVNFKIDKRGQIVEVAQSWIGADQRVGHGGDICDNIVRYVYGQVGLSVSQTGTTTDLYNVSIPSSGQGGMIFYRNAGSPTWQHVGIDIGGSIVDQNCGCPHNQTDPPTVGSHLATHPDLQRTNQNPPHYDQPPFYRDLQELVSLDGE